MKRWLLLVAGIGASAGCVVWLWRVTDINTVGAMILSAGLTPWLGAALIYLSGFWLRAIRWRMMLANVGTFRTAHLWQSIVLGYAGNNVLPFRLGEVFRAVIFGKLTRASRTTGLASIVAERLLDALTLGGILVAALLGITRHGDARAELVPVFIGAGMLGAAGLTMIMVSCLAMDRMVALAGRVSPRLGTLAVRCAQAVVFIRQPRQFFKVFLVSLAIWITEGLMFVVFAGNFGLPHPWLIGFLSLAVINFGILIPAAPGYLGVFQAAAVVAFTAVGQSAEAGLAFGVLVHSAQFIPLTLLGLILAIPHWSNLSQAGSDPQEARIHG